MDKDITIRIAGEAGQGIQTVGAALCSIFKKLGLSIFANQDYMSRVRGGNNFFQIRVSSQPLYTLRQKADIIVCLDKESIPLHKPVLSDNGIMIIDTNRPGAAEASPGLFEAPLHDLALQAGGSDLFINSVACGAVAGIMKLDLKRVQETMKVFFAGKSAEMIAKNIDAVTAGFDFSAKHFEPDRFKVANGSNGSGNTLLMNGNEAIGLGAIRAGCKFYSAYPMTPSTSIMDTVAHYAQKYQILVEQAEDEIAAINMIIGASFAGVRSMTATSGGGFCLMVEGVSLAGMTETPVVAVDAQRPAPATGFPTRTEQADLDFLIHAGHGEFARVVYAPGTIEEAYYLTVRAFNIAEKYQVPVLIMTDQHLADSYRIIEPFDPKKARVERFIVSKKDSQAISSYKRYQLTESGISLRAIPSWIDEVIYADSDEHDEEGHITEDAAMRIKMVEKRLHKKMTGLRQEIDGPTTYNLNKAETVLVGFGSTYGVMKEVCESSRSRKLGFMHFSQVWPFPHKNVCSVLKNKDRVITVENNAGAQLARLLKRECGVEATGSVLRFDGRPFDLEYVKERVTNGNGNGHK